MIAGIGIRKNLHEPSDVVLWLFTHKETSPLSMTVLRQSRHALYVQPNMESWNDMVYYLDGKPTVVLFDNIPNSGQQNLRRSFRFVHRTGRCHFPDWVPADITSGVVLYPSCTPIPGQLPAVLRETHDSFLKWRALNPRSAPRDSVSPAPTRSFVGLNSWNAP